jgi:hypothetical protein
MQPTDSNEDTNITINKMPSRNNRTGRIHPHQQGTQMMMCQYWVPACKALPKAVQRNHEAGDDRQLSKGLSSQEYENIIKYWEQNYPEYHMLGTLMVADEDLKNPTKLYFNPYKQDLIYIGINVKVVLRFLLQSKIKED